MLHLRRRALIALLGSGLVLPALAGGVAAVSPTIPATYSITFCYSASDNFVYIHQVWSGMLVDDVNGGISSHKGGFGFDNQLVTPSTTGDDNEGVLADPHSYLVAGEVRYQGAVLGTGSMKKPKGSWTKLPAC